SMAVVWGRYADEGDLERLPWAEKEAADLIKRYGAAGVDAESRPVLRAIKGEPRAEVLHFSVHGKFDPQGDNGLLLLAAPSRKKGNVSGGGRPASVGFRP